MGCQQAYTRKELELLIGLLNDSRKVSVFRLLIPEVNAGFAPFCSSATKLATANLFECWLLADLAWWQTFIACWNGVSFLNPLSHLGSWGCGAWHGCKWFQVQ